MRLPVRYPLNLRCGYVIVALLGILACPVAAQAQPIGITHIELTALRVCIGLDWCKAKHPLSQKPAGVIRNPAHVFVYAQPAGDWWYRGNTRPMNAVAVKDDDFQKLNAIMDSDEYISFLNALNTSPKFSTSAARTDAKSFYAQRKQLLLSVDGLKLSAGDKSAYDRLIWEGLLEHPSFRLDLNSIEKDKRDDGLDKLFERGLEERKKKIKQLIELPLEVPEITFSSSSRTNWGN